MFEWIFLVVLAFYVADGQETSTALIRETRPLSSSSFDEIVIEGALDVALIQLAIDANQTSSVEIEATAESQRHLLVDVLDGHRLSISVTGILVTKDNPRISIQFNGPLRRYSVSGGSRTLTADNTSISSPAAEKFLLEKTGGSLVILNLDVHEFHAELAGAGLVQLTGQVRELAVFDISGSLEVEAMKLICKRSRLEVGGNSILGITVLDDIEIDTSGMSQVFYQLRAPREPRKAVAGSMATITRVSS